MAAKFVNKWLIIAILFIVKTTVLAQEEPAAEPVDTIPDYVKAYTKACKLVDSLKYEEALPILKGVLKKNPDYFLAHNKMAYIFIKQSKNKEATKSLAKAEKISQFNYETLKLKGINFFDLENYRESKTAIDSAVSIAQDDKIDDTELYYYQALLMYKGKSYKTALATCVLALDVNPKLIEVMKLKAQIRFAMKDYKNAIIDYNEVIKAMPAEKPDYDLYKQRATCKFETKDYKGAISDWSVFLDGDPKNEEAYIYRAINKLNINDNTGAIADLDEAVKINPKNPVSYCNRGIGKAGNKMYIEAKKDLDFAIKLKFDYAAAFVNRAAVKMASKDKIGACEDLEKADSLGDQMAVKLIQQYCK